MNKISFKLFTVVILFSLMVSPAIAQALDREGGEFNPTAFSRPSRPEPELVPYEILNAFEGGMTIEEFLIRNQGPVPNALLDFADTPLVVVVQLEDPPLAEYVLQQDLSRDLVAQVSYVDQLKSQQAVVLNQITQTRSDVRMIGESFTKVLNGFMLRIPASALSDIRAIDGVKSVSRAPQHIINLSNSVPLINADAVWEDPGYTGDGITIAIIDTGIDYTHAMFGGPGTPEAYQAIDPDVLDPDVFPTTKVIGGYDFAGSDYDAGDPDHNIPVPDGNPIDEHGHGTHVAATAAGVDIGFGSGVAPDAKLYALKVFGRSGSTNLVLHAIEWAMDPLGLGHLGEPVDVINMSLGSNWGPADESDPEFVAIENASALGVVVVASAGNAGNAEYIVGSPSTTDSAISVAASTTGFVTAPFIEFAADAPYQYAFPFFFVGESETTEVFTQSQPSLWTDRVPYTPANPFTETLSGDLIDVETIDGGFLCNEDIAGIEGEPLEDAIALISRGECSFEEKINNAEALGAAAAIIYNNAPGIISMATGETTLPAGSITQADGEILAALAPAHVSVGPDSNVATFPAEEPADTIAAFSSRGPRGFDSKLKPEITAPGVAIFAADMGTGDLGTSMSGTSMSAPHIAGIAALMKEANPRWNPVHIKAAMMNTAVDLADAFSAQIPRQGAGRVDAFQSVTTSLVAYGDPHLVSLSWGVIELGQDDYTDVQTITLRNFSDQAVTLAVDTLFTSDATGAALTSSVNEVTVPPNLAASVEVTLSLDATEVRSAFGDLDEYYGFVTFTGSEETLRVPFYFLPRPYTQLTEVDANTAFDADAGLGYVDVAQSGPIPSSLWAFPVSLVSEQDPDIDDAADLRYVGMNYDGWDHPDYGPIIEASFAMWGPSHTNQPFFNEVDLFIDTPTGSVANFNYNLGWFVGAGQNNQWIVVQVDFTDGMVYLGSPWLIFADFNSGYQEWWLPADWQYVEDVFDYEVLTFDWFGNFKFAGGASFDISRPPINWAILDENWDDWLLTPHNETASLIFSVADPDGFIFSGVEGIMLADYFGKPGSGQAYYWPLEVSGLYANLQVAHLAPFAEDASVTITLNGEPALTDFDYGESTEYLTLSAGEFEVAVYPTPPGESGMLALGEPVIEETVILEADEYYTLIAIGDGENQALALILLEDDLTEPEEGKFHLRFGNLAPFTDEDTEAFLKFDSSTVHGNVVYGDVTDFIEVDGGSYIVRYEHDGIFGFFGRNSAEEIMFDEGTIVSIFTTGEKVITQHGLYLLPAGEIGTFIPLADLLD